jgi:hypothetical protein
MKAQKAALIAVISIPDREFAVVAGVLEQQPHGSEPRACLIR